MSVTNREFDGRQQPGQGEQGETIYIDTIPHTFKPGDRVRYLGTDPASLREAGAEGVVDNIEPGSPYPVRVQFDDLREGVKPEDLTLVAPEPTEQRATPQQPTPEQRAAIRLARERIGEWTYIDLAPQDVQTMAVLLDALPAALTAPQPVLPTEPGVYADKEGSPWHVEGECWWFGNTDRYPNANPEHAKHIQSFAPFRRLVPERPAITREQIQDAIAEYDDTHLGSDPDLVEALYVALVSGTDR